MSQFRKKPVVIEAVRWDGFVLETTSEQQGITRHPCDEVKWHEKCPHCAADRFCHGQIATLEGVHIVCPGDWIITGVKGEKYPIKNDIFLETYDEVLD